MNKQTVYGDFRIGDRVRLPDEHRGEMEFIISNRGEINDILAGCMGDVTLIARPVYMTPDRVALLERVQLRLTNEAHAWERGELGYCGPDVLSASEAHADADKVAAMLAECKS